MNIYRCRSFLFIVLLLLCVISPQAVPAAEKNFLWRAATGASTIYLLGSVHLMKKEAYPLSGVIEEAFDACDTLAVEADISDIRPGTLDMLRRAGFYGPNDSLARHISTETYRHVTEEGARLGLPPFVLDRQRPWFLGLTLSSIELMRSGYDPDYGIDRHFLGRALGRKKIVELESIEYQVGLLSGLSENEQEIFLLYTIKDLKTMGEQADSLIKAWRTGDTGSIQSILARSIGNDDRLKAVYEKVMTGRNRNMAKKISGYLTSGGRVLVIVGAGHMVGDEGIIALLRQEGYRVDQL